MNGGIKEVTTQLMKAVEGAVFIAWCDLNQLGMVVQAE